MKPSFLSAVLALCLLGPVAGHAEKADRDKPMNVEADALRYDDLRQVSIFTGRVVLTKGTILIRGARLEVRQDADGYQYGIVTAEPGTRAFYRQKREGLDEWIEGEGQTIDYDGKADRVKFIGQAELRRLRGAQLADEMIGSVITYENTTDVFTVDGGPASPRPGGRVRAVLAPREGASVPAPAGAASAPRAAVRNPQLPPPAPPAQLKPSTGLSGDAK